MRAALNILVLAAAMIGINCCALMSRRIENITRPAVTKVLYVDDTFGIDEIRCIEAAASSWTKKTRGIAKISVYPATRAAGTFPVNTSVHDVVMRRATSEDGIILFIERMSGAFLFGYYEPKSDHSEITMVIDRYSSRDVCKIVVMHELGHALGLHHSSDPGSLMYGGAETMPTGITHRDLTDFCRIYGCRSDDLKD